MDNIVALDPAARRRPSAQSSGRGAEVLTVPELAEYLRLSLATTYVYLRDGTIPVGERIGRRWIVPRARLDAWLSGQREGGR
jgi:excisionase family DNA binding protein